MDKKDRASSFVFISYAHEDLARIEPLVTQLASHFSIWWDLDIKVGSEWRPELQEHLDEAACVVVFWSLISVESTFVRSEASWVLDNLGILIQVKLDEGAKIPLGFGEKQYIDLSKWKGGKGASLDRLVDSIQTLVERGPTWISYPGSLVQDNGAIENSSYATEKLRNLTQRLQGIGEILVPGSAPTQDLIGALEEVDKTYRVVNKAIRKFVKPAGRKGSIKAARYMKMERGKLRADIENGRGHCSRILVYYRRYGGLRDWIQNKIPQSELEQLDGVFDSLGTADGDLFRALVNIGELLTNESRVIVNLLVSGQKKAARKRILKGREILKAPEKQLTEAILELHKIERSLGYAG